MNSGAVIEALQKAFTDGKIARRSARSASPGNRVIIRKITVPMMTPAELDEQIHWEAEQHIPFDIKDVQVDYQVLRRRPEASQMDLLLVAAKRDQINDYAQLARTRSSSPSSCDIDAFTVQNLFEVSRGSAAGSDDRAHQRRREPLVAQHRRERRQRLHARDRERRQRDHRRDPEAARRAVRAGRGLQMRRLPTSAAPGIVPRAGRARSSKSVSDSIAGEIQRSLDFFLATSGEAEISRIYVTGGSSNLPSLGAGHRATLARPGRGLGADGAASRSKPKR